MVKLEGGGWTAPTVQFLVERGIPVCAHLGLTPQTVHALGAIERGEVATVAEVLARFPAELHGPLQLSLLWLCKLGILEWSA